MHLNASVFGTLALVYVDALLTDSTNTAVFPVQCFAVFRTNLRLPTLTDLHPPARLVRHGLLPAVPVQSPGGGD